MSTPDRSFHPPAERSIAALQVEQPRVLDAGGAPLRQGGSHPGTLCWASPLEVAKADTGAVPLLVKPALDVVAHVLQDGDVHAAHLLPPLSAGLDVALLHTHKERMPAQHSTA